MTNDFAVADQQTRKSPLWPTVGAVAGGFAGYKIGNNKGAKKDWESLINEVKDTTDFSTKEDPDMWKGVKDKLAEVEKLEEELKKASEAKLPADSEIAKKLEKVEKEADERLASLRSEAARKAGKPETVTTATKIVEYNPNWSMTEAEAKEYKELYKTYTDELAKLKGKKEFTDIERAISDRRVTIETLVEDAKKDADSLIELRKTAKPRKQAAYPANMQEFVDKFAKEYFEEALVRNGEIKLTNAELIEIAKNKLLDKAPGGKLGIDYFEVTAKDGSKKFVQFDKAQKKLYQEKLASKVESESQKLTNSFSRMVEVKELLANTDKAKTKLANELKIDSGSLKSAGFVDGSAKRNINMIDTIKSWSKADIEKDIKILKDAGMTDYVPKEKLQNADVQALIEKYKNVKVNSKTGESLIKTPKDVYEMLSSRLGIIRKYDGRVEGLNKELDTLYTDCDKTLADLIKKKEGMTSKELRAAESQIRGKFGKFLEKIKGTKVSESAEGVADSISEADLPKELKERLEKIRAEYREAAKTGGKVDEAAKKIAEENRNKAKTELEEAGKKLAEKLGKTGKKGKIVGAVVGAAAGLGLLWMIAPKKPKEA